MAVKQRKLNNRDKDLKDYDALLRRLIPYQDNFTGMVENKRVREIMAKLQPIAKRLNRHGGHVNTDIYKILVSEKNQNPSTRELNKCRQMVNADDKSVSEHIAGIPISAGFDWERNPHEDAETVLERAINFLNNEIWRIKSEGLVYHRSTAKITKPKEEQLRRLRLQLKQVRLDKGKQRNPKDRQRFVIVDKRGERTNKTVYTDFDKAQEYVDRHNNLYGNEHHRLFVMDVKDLGLKDQKRNDSKYRSRNSNEAITPKHGKQNETAQDFRDFKSKRLADLVQMFQGQSKGIRHKLLESNLTPKDKSLLGHLVLMKVKRGGKVYNIQFDGDAILAIDIRKNLWTAGKDSIITDFPKPKPGQLKEFGKLIQIDYVTAKKHIEGGKTVRFWHELGEVDGECPTLFVDHDGFPVIIGGGYDVWRIGIVN